MLSARSQFVLISCLFLLSLGWSCTDVLIKSDDGYPVHGRSMEFAVELGRNLGVQPAENDFVLDSPFEGKPGKSYNNKFAYFWMVAAVGGFDAISDGLNEKGLSIGTLFFPGYAKFQDVPRKEASKSIPHVDFGHWVLGNFKDVASVRNALKDVLVYDAAGGELPCHFSVYDKTGAGIIIEYEEGTLSVYDSIGIFTNAPSYGWHLDNLQQYEILTPYNPPMTPGIGQGFGMKGLPGDWTAPSRFVRAAIQKKFLNAKANTAETLNAVAHIMNSVDIIKGVAREKVMDGDVVVEEHSDITQWIVLKDLRRGKMYYRLYDCLNFGVVSLDNDKLRELKGQKGYMIELSCVADAVVFDPFKQPKIPLKKDL